MTENIYYVWVVPTSGDENLCIVLCFYKFFCVICLWTIPLRCVWWCPIYRSILIIPVLQLLYNLTSNSSYASICMLLFPHHAWNDWQVQSLQGKYASVRQPDGVSHWGINELIFKYLLIDNISSFKFNVQ